MKNDDILLITDNCGGHEREVNQLGLRIELLPPRSASKYQTIDLGLVAHAKIRYRAILLGQIVDNTITWHSGEHNFPPTSNSGLLGVSDGHLPHVGDAMYMFNEAWSRTSKSTILKCWKCFNEDQVQHAKSLYEELKQVKETTGFAALVSQNEVQEIYESIQLSTMMSSSSTATVAVMNELPDIRDFNELSRLFNLSMPEDEDRTHTQISNSTILAMYTRMVEEDEEAVAEQAAPAATAFPGTSSRLCKEITLLTEGNAVIWRDEQALNALKVALSQIEELCSAQDRL